MRKSYGLCVLAAIAALSALVAGCNGEYILTVPEQVAPAGGEAAVVARLQRREVGPVLLAAGDASVSMRVQDGPTRGAYTDTQGYAAATVPVPQAPGVYHAALEHIDKDGHEVRTFVPVYVWDPQRPVIAVDVDGLEASWTAKSGDAAKAMQKLGERYNIVYLSSRSVTEHAKLHVSLQAAGLPDGAVISWESSHMFIGGGNGQFNAAQLTLLQKAFPHLEAGLTNRNAAAAVFSGIGMKTVAIGPEKVSAPRTTTRASWTEVANKGI